jgi:hypothetical protein
MLLLMIFISIRDLTILIHSIQAKLLYIEFDYFHYFFIIFSFISDFAVLPGPTKQEKLLFSFQE